MYPLSARTDVPRIDDDRCRCCRRCLAAQTCRYHAFVRFDREEPPVIDAARCGGCRICIPACPFDAVLPPNGRDLPPW